MLSLSNKTTTRLFILAGFMNLSVLIFSRFFTNTTITTTDPAVMSTFGLLLIVLWGFAYIAVATKYQQVKLLVAVFAIEKLAYGGYWLYWILNNNVTAVYEKDVMAGMFFSMYGMNDFVFCVFFFVVYIGLQFKKDGTLVKL